LPFNYDSVILYSYIVDLHGSKGQRLLSRAEVREDFAAQVGQCEEARRRPANRNSVTQRRKTMALNNGSHGWVFVLFCLLAGFIVSGCDANDDDDSGGSLAAIDDDGQDNDSMSDDDAVDDDTTTDDDSAPDDDTADSPPILTNVHFDPDHTVLMQIEGVPELWYGSYMFMDVCDLGNNLLGGELNILNPYSSTLPMDTYWSDLSENFDLSNVGDCDNPVTIWILGTFGPESDPYLDYPEGELCFGVRTSDSADNWTAVDNICVMHDPVK